MGDECKECGADHGDLDGPPCHTCNPSDALDHSMKQLRADRDRLAVRVGELEKTVKFLRYYECSDDAVRTMTDALLKAVEDSPFEGDVENLAMNLDQYRKQRDEAAAQLASVTAERDEALAASIDVDGWRASVDEAMVQYERCKTERDAALSDRDALRGEVERMRALLELAMSKWVSLSGNRVWGAQEAEERARCADALGPESMARVTAGHTYNGPTRKA